jgi:two-component system NtrC family sensor kinase
VESTVVTSSAMRRPAQVCGGMVAILGAAALVGWAIDHPVLLGVRADYIPMAPNTALAFVVLGLGLAGAVGDRRGGRGLAGPAAALVALIGILRLCEYSTGVDLAVDRWFFHVRAGTFGLVPLGRMSMATAVAFVAASIAVLSLTLPARWRPAADLTGGCGLITGVIGLVFALCYLFSPNAPLLYGTASIPMALNTALCLVTLGIGLAAAAGPAAFPLLRLCGPSIRARLLRSFLPLVVATVAVVAWLTHVVSSSAGASTAAIASAAMATLAILAFAAICERIAGRIGQQLEQAEAALQCAHDLLEVKVDERTRDLSRANAELAQALRDSCAAHDSLQVAHRGLKQAQSRMLQQAKMASLGQTAAGVAHEINNPLSFVTNNLLVLKREVGSLHDILCLYQQSEGTLALYQRELYTRISDLAEQVDMPFVLANLDTLLDRSRAGLQRIQKIVEDLRDFAHLDEAEFKEADLNEGVVATVNLMRTLADRRQVALETDLGPSPRVTCFPAKINLVTQSLVSNAIDASPPGGRVVVSTRAVGDGVAIEVTDTGCGIDPAIRERIFDPFFTTKPIGKGTGLGLSMSYGIVKDHGGLIDVESAPGRGTRFTVYLPLVPPVESFPGGAGVAKLATGA